VVSSAIGERIERGDARRRWLIRATAFGVSTVIAALALLNAGVDPSKWGWWPFHHPATAGAICRKRDPGTPSARLPDEKPRVSTRLPGTDSSVSVVPKHLI